MIHDDGIFLIVSGITENGDDGVLTGGKIVEFEMSHGSSGGEGFLRVEEDVGHGIESDLVICGKDSHSLFTHGGLIGITRRLWAIKDKDQLLYVQLNNPSSLT